MMSCFGISRRFHPDHPDHHCPQQQLMLLPNVLLVGNQFRGHGFGNNVDWIAVNGLVALESLDVRILNFCTVVCECQCL